MPDSQVNRDYLINQQVAKIETGELPYGKQKHEMLEKLARYRTPTVITHNLIGFSTTVSPAGKLA